MAPFRKILFPIDFSDAAAAMVPYVAEMAQRFNATVTVLNAFDAVADFSLAPSLLDPFNSEPIAIPYTRELQELRKQREQHLQEFSQAQFSRVAHTTRIEDGDPATVIERTAQRENTDLIMMPTKGHGRFRRLLFGSVAAKVLHDVRCPVLTSAHEPHQGSASTTGYRSILCAVELNPEADVVLAAAALIAQTYGARICLLHIEPSFREHGGQGSAQTIRSAFEGALNAESRGVGDLTVRVLDAAIPEGIRRAAIEEKADLVVVGRGHQRETLSRIWSHLYTIIRESPCPVLSV
jgi:nucleotide-binding universal stress UspA family protein